ncbi:DUF7169 domain-containing protein [Streptomyces cyaneofuscatus]|uniref:DUF7169 domain-containing protein n=1 Tax=Streptomyces cyaneofuscatus TaxID=66883 RepID=UPI003F4E15FB
MTYSPNHVADGQHLTDLLDTLERDLIEIRQMVAVYDDAVTMPGRRPDVDPDGTGRRMTADPSRPTENIALDGARAALLEQLETGAKDVAYAIAYVRGTIASMDRTLARWEGEEAVHIPGGCNVRTDGTPLHEEPDARPGGTLGTDGPSATPPH